MDEKEIELKKAELDAKEEALKQQEEKIEKLRQDYVEKAQKSAYMIKLTST